MSSSKIQIMQLKPERIVDQNSNSGSVYSLFQGGYVSLRFTICTIIEVTGKV